MNIYDPSDASFATEAAEKLDRYADAVLAAMRTTAQLKQEFTAQQQSLDDVTAQIRLSIIMDVAENGKARYSNEDARNAALKVALADDSRITFIRAELLRVQSEMADAQVEGDDAANRRRDMHAVLGYLSNWLMFNAPTPALSGRNGHS